MIKIVLSFDFELGWGDINSGDWQRKENLGVYSNARMVLPSLIKKMDKMGVVSTWGVVSSMIQSELSLDNFEFLPFEYKSKLLSFLASANKESIAGGDIFEKVFQSDSIEIASHSATHLIYSQVDSLEQALTDFNLSFEQLERATGSRPQSFIFPENRVDSISNFIQPSCNISFRCSSVLGRSGFDKAASILSLREFDVSESIVANINGSTIQSDSLLFNWHGSHKFYRKYALQRKALSLLNTIKFSKSNQIYHVWLHPCDLSEDFELLIFFEQFINKLVEYANEDKVEFCTMSMIHKGIDKYVY